MNALLFCLLLGAAVVLHVLLLGQAVLIFALES